MRALLRAVLLLLVLAVLVVGGAAWFATRQFDVPGPLPQAKTVVVPRGGLDQVADALAAQGVVDNALYLRAAALVTQSTLKAGELEFPAHASLRQVLSVLRNGRPVQHRVTIPEGLTALQIAALLDKADALAGQAEPPAEGSVLPETYTYERGTGRNQVLDRARVAMDRTLDGLWAARAPNLPLTTPQQMVTLASIVERETARPEERPHVAGVYLNRLRLGMKLQSDPTVVYAVSNRLGVLDHGLTRAELDRDDPYNTYRYAGLPPGPIASPGLAALRAVSQPTPTDDLFFVADGTGGHVFARTEDEHRRNVTRWREIERARTGGVPPGPAQGTGVAPAAAPSPLPVPMPGAVPR